MHDYFEGKVAAVTGAASGIGLAICEGLLEYGAGPVLLADVDGENLERHVERLGKAYPGRAFGLKADVTTERDCTAVVHAAAEHGRGRLDLLFNNAGAGFYGAFEAQTDDDWRRAFDLNFFSVVHAIRAALPIMRAQGGGQILNTASGIAYVAMAYQTRYSATKSAVLGLTTALRYELWDENIKLSTVIPGTVATAIWAGSTVPSFAIKPEESAAAILKGAMNNDRVIFVTQDDVEGAKNAGDADLAGYCDQYGLMIARKRRSGEGLL